MTTKINVNDMIIFYYDRVYLCKSKIRGIECTKINLIANTENKFKTYEFSTTIIIPICKYSPIILDNFKLENKY